MLRHPVLTALALVAPLVLLLASCGEDEPAVADTPSTATVESDGVTVDVSYDADGLTAVFTSGAPST